MTPADEEREAEMAGAHDGVGVEIEDLGRWKRTRFVLLGREVTDESTTETAAKMRRLMEQLERSPT